MSATYPNWARENYQINGLEDESRQQFLRADVLELLQSPARHGIDRLFDQIYLDTPSFSNSKKMQQTFDVQRDHENMIEQSMKLLNKDGLLLCLTNRKGFKLADTLSSQYAISDISRETIPEDFKRRPGIHRCWEIRHNDYQA